MTRRFDKVMVVGATGGIGAALVDALAARDDVGTVHACARRAPADAGKVVGHAIDLNDEASIAAAAAAVGEAIDLVIVATGELRDPEKGWARQSADGYARAFAVNATGPALVGKHVLDRLSRDGAVFAALGARVGSIGDNRLGGWHAYRAAKAALVMIVRNFALELAARRRTAIAVTIHPGTVATPLSDPFAGARARTTPADAARHILAVIDALTPDDSGWQLAWDGTRIAP